MAVGFIHSIETAGLVDGPGIRFVVFMQGCRLRCAYCHNPDTWKCGIGQQITVEELFEKVRKYIPYFKNSGGGVTLSGGEPLLQPDFAAEFFGLCKSYGINTALDTSGFGNGDDKAYDMVLKNTDLVILDIKHVNEEQHKKLTGCSRDGFLKFLEAAERNKNRLWIRHVAVPGLTDSDEHITKLAEYINTIPNVEKVELLPYHTFGVNKYRELQIPYKLDGVPPLNSTRLSELNIILENKLLHGHRAKVKPVAQSGGTGTVHD